MKNNRVVIYVNDALRSDLKSAALTHDVSLGELCRRLLRLGLFTDNADSTAAGISPARAARIRQQMELATQRLGVLVEEADQ